MLTLDVNTKTLLPVSDEYYGAAGFFRNYPSFASNGFISVIKFIRKVSDSVQRKRAVL